LKIYPSKLSKLAKNSMDEINNYLLTHYEGQRLSKVIWSKKKEDFNQGNQVTTPVFIRLVNGKIPKFNYAQLKRIFNHEFKISKKKIEVPILKNTEYQKGTVFRVTTVFNANDKARLLEQRTAQKNAAIKSILRFLSESKRQWITIYQYIVLCIPIQ